MNLWVPVALTFVTTALWVLFVHDLTTKRRREIIKRINEQIDYYGKQQTKKKTSATFKEVLRQISRIFAARRIAVKVESRLVKAGIPLKGEEGLTLWLLSAVGFGFAGFMMTGDFAYAVLLGILGSILPWLFVNSSINKRLKKLDAQLGSALTIMSNSLRAGFSFLQTVELVSKEMPDPIASEFRRMLREMHLGTSTEQALINLSKRIGSKDIDLVVTAVLIQRQVGGNLAEVLDNISNTIRERIRVAGEVKTLTAQGRISGIIIGLLPVFIALVLFIINREYIISLFTDRRGVIMLSVGLILQVLGLLVIRRIVDIKL
ncbi:MAG TPA: secretion system protein [Peptococcaceae bacterium]|nr:MAG: Type II secretion system F domain protein [Clostridia bacterium 41_269]HBT20205.1 secretion system protein [Peptococcaceae bacterium]